MSKLTVEQRRTVEDAILAAMENGVAAWTRPWAVGGIRNFTTMKPYAGMLNHMILGAVAAVNDWSDDWAGAGQIRKAGGTVAEDAIPTTILAPIMRKFVKEDEQTGKKVTINFIKGFRDVKVYNVAQSSLAAPDREINGDDPIEAAEAVMKAMPLAPPIKHSGDVACYSPLFDEVTLPPFAQFETANDYYATAFHELAHSTGHEKRLGREFGKAFGNDEYAKEELVAEMTACHLVNMLGLDHIERSASYVKHWHERLMADRSILLDAMDDAAQAARWIEGSHHKARAAKGDGGEAVAA